MDLLEIKSSVLNQITNTSGLYSLQLQNHIYGCFIIMEDIAQKTIELSENIISGTNFSLDIDKHFSEIGIRYGFIMDTKLILTTYTPEYKQIWLKYFKDISLDKNIENVDKIEDCLIEVIHTNIHSNDLFFINALDTGSLTQDWIDKALLLLCPTPTVIDIKDDDNVSVTTHNIISNANVEKNITPLKSRRLSTTRRKNKANISIVPNKILSKTHRRR
jgi:hypothetical protein